MVLESGNPPYLYDIQAPPNITDPACTGIVIGFSGIMIEQPHFVVTAEYRKWNNRIDSHSFPADMNLYPIANVSPFYQEVGPFEPQADGATFTNNFPLPYFFSDYIINVRSALDALFAKYADDTNYTTNEHRNDWLSQVYTDIPINPDLLSDRYRRPEPVSSTLEDDPVADGRLGGSGVFMEVDFGEIAFNPYPFMSSTAIADARNLGSFLILAGPVFPAFQRTNGSLISLNVYDPPSNTFPNAGLSSLVDTSHVSAGNVRLDGYVLLGDTDYTVGRTITGTDFVSHFVLSSSDTRDASDGVDVPTSRVFANPGALSSGIYRVSPINRKSDFPNTIVESGLVSPWPRNSQYYPNGFSRGYHSFDDGFWLLDRATSPGAPSGLGLHSPFTGQAVWLRYADPAKSTSILSHTPDTWGEFVGLEINGGLIYRSDDRTIPPTSTVFDSTGMRFLAQTYDLMLENHSEIITGDTGVFAGQNFTVRDFIRDESGNWWFTLEASFLNTLFQFSSDFATPGNILKLRRSTSAPNAGFLNDGHRHVFFNSQNLCYSVSTASHGIIPWTIDPGNDFGGLFAATLDMTNEKSIDLSPFLGSVTGGIRDMQVVIGGTHVSDGLWALIFVSPNDWYWCRITQAATSWTVHELIPVSSVTTGAFIFIDFIVMDVN